MITEARESILRKIRKLLALAKGGTTEEEAAQAARRAHELLAEHNLAMSEVEQAVEQGDRVLDDDAVDGTRDIWPAQLWSATAQLHFCRYFYRDVHDHGRLIGLRHAVVGRRHNVEVTKLTACYLVDAVKRLAVEAARSVPGDERRLYRDSFRRACGQRLAQRVHALRTAATAPPPDAPRSTLPALLSLYRTESEANEALLAHLGFRLGGPARHDRLTHAGGADAGRRAAETISLHRQIGTSAEAPPAPPRARGTSQIEMFG
jgi:hypothetical protein